MDLILIITMTVLYLRNSESFNVDIALNIQLVSANMSPLQISLIALFQRVSKHFTFYEYAYVLPQIALQ